MQTNSIKLIAGGDLCPADHYFTVGHGFAGHLAVENALNSLSPLLKSSDLAIANLECPLSQFSNAKSSIEKNAFRGDPETADVIKSSGINYLNISNNHIMQHGSNAFLDTINCLNSAGIQPVGLTQQGKKITPVYHSANGLRLSLSGISFVKDPYAPSQLFYDTPEIDDLISFVKQEARYVDHVILSIHWGSEGPDIPSSFEIKLGRQLIDAGASVILGHHSHIIRPVEYYGNGLICYSLGNLLFDLEWYYPYTIGILLEISLGPKGSRPAWTPHFTQCKHNLIKLLSKDKCETIRQVMDEKAIWIKSTDLNVIDTTHNEMLKAIECKQKIIKLAYFICMLPFGDTRLKLSFILSKINKRFM